MTYWIIDEYLFDNNPLYRKIPTVLGELGIKHYLSRYVPLSDEQDYGPLLPAQPTILYGTVGFIKKCPYPYNPGAYGYNQNRNCSIYLNHLPSEDMLNSDYVMIQFREFERNPQRFYDLFSTNELFIRPNSGDKVFAGRSINIANFEFEMKSLRFSSVVDDTIVLISGAKEIFSEFRFIVGAGDVISGSEYRWDNRLDVRADYDPDCYDMAVKVAKQDWQMDTVYTVDVAQTPHVCLRSEGGVQSGIRDRRSRI